MEIKKSTIVFWVIPVLLLGTALFYREEITQKMKPKDTIHKVRLEETLIQGNT